MRNESNDVRGLVNFDDILLINRKYNTYPRVDVPVKKEEHDVIKNTILLSFLIRFGHANRILITQK